MSGRIDITSVMTAGIVGLSLMPTCMVSGVLVSVCLNYIYKMLESQIWKVPSRPDNPLSF